LTREQIILMGFIVVAFLGGWIASVVTRRRGRSATDMPAPRHDVEPVTPAASRSEGPWLAEEVGEALRSDAANDGMLSVMRTDGEPTLSELELDLADWGFTYGVAWARAHERAAGGPDEAVARQALDAAQRVFRAYTGGDDWTQRTLEDGHEGSTGSNGSGAPQPPRRAG
jgi:hypothetical protein